MQKDTNKSNMFMSLVFLIVLGFFVLLVWSYDKPIEKLLVILAGFMFLFPIFIGMFGSMVRSQFKVKNKPHTDVLKYGNILSPNINSNSTEEGIGDKKYKTKTCTTEGYEELRDLLKESVKNKLVGRESILKFKSELRYRLGTHIECYNGFEFKNDMHEIYTLLKSKSLAEQDYDYLSNVFIGLLIN